MSDTVNLAGKDIIVNSVTSMQDRSAEMFARAKTSIAVGKTSKSLDEAKVDILKNGTSLARIGARVNAQDVRHLYVYGYNPREPYSASFGDAYYVNTGYVNCNGLSYPVYINNSYVEFDLSLISTRGTWTVVIQKVSGSDVWAVNVLFPSPDANHVMTWTDIDGNEAAIDSNTWVIGSFVLDIGTGSTNSIMGLYMQSEALTPASFLEYRFLQVLGDAPGGEYDDLSAWADAMGCDQIFKRLAVLSLFVNSLSANSAFIARLNATTALFHDIEITGDSVFHGEITSSAFTTTVERSGGTPYSLGLNTGTRYWGYNNLAAKLRNLLTSSGYYSTTGSYPVVRRATVGSSVLMQVLMTGSSSVPVGTVLYTSPRSQTVTVAFSPSGATSAGGGYIRCDGTQYSIHSSMAPTVTFHMNKGSQITAGTGGVQIASGYSLVLYDVASDFSREFTFFDSNGNIVSVGDYGSGQVTIGYGGSSVTSDALYKWSGMGSASGSGQVQAGSVYSITDDMGNVIASNKSIYSVQWSSTSRILFIDSNLQQQAVDTSTYYQAFSASFTFLASTDSVQSKTITPKNGTSTLGTVGSPWAELWGKHLGHVNGDGYNADSRASSYRVWGAVFN